MRQAAGLGGGHAPGRRARGGHGQAAGLEEDGYGEAVGLGDVVADGVGLGPVGVGDAAVGTT